MAGGYGVWQNGPGTHDCPVAGWRTENKAARRLSRSFAEEDKVEEAVCSLPGDDDVVLGLVFQT